MVEIKVSTFEEARARHLVSEKQLRIDLIQLFGWVSGREGFEEAESALYIALQRLYWDEPDWKPHLINR